MVEENSRSITSAHRAELSRISGILQEKPSTWTIAGIMFAVVGVALLPSLGYFNSEFNSIKVEIDTVSEKIDSIEVAAIKSLNASNETKDAIDSLESSIALSASYSIDADNWKKFLPTDVFDQVAHKGLWPVSDTRTLKI